MQPHPPQLPTDAPTSPAPKNLKKGAFILLGIIAVVAALIAFMLPKNQVEANRTPTAAQPQAPSTQRAQSNAYKVPTR